MFSDDDWIDPVTIVPDMYDGRYSKGRWLAFPTRPHDVPMDLFGDDIRASTWWELTRAYVPVGLGDGPEAAYSDLETRLNAIAPNDNVEDEAGQLRRWEIMWPSGKSITVASRKVPSRTVPDEGS